MNILYLHQYFKTPSEPGGTRSYEFARRLVARGHTVHMITATSDAPNGGSWRESVVDSVHLHAIPVPYRNQMSYGQRILAFFRFAYHAARRAASLPADIIFATSTPLTIALPAVYAARRHKVPMVFEVRDLWPEGPIALGALKGKVPVHAAEWLELFAYRHSARIIALSPTMKEGIVRKGYPREKVHVIPNSSDLELFRVDASLGVRFRKEHAWLSNRPLVLYAGTFGLVNGVDYLVRVAKEMLLLQPEVRFLLVGDGREAERVRDYAARLEVLDYNLFIMPPVAKTAMPALLSAASVATSTVIDVPALWANSANKVFDAFSAGRPIVINHEGWLADLVRESGAGIVLPVNDSVAAAHLLTVFLSDPQRLEAAGRAARQLAETRFSRDLLFEEFERVLLLAVEEHRNP